LTFINVSLLITRFTPSKELSVNPVSTSNESDNNDLNNNLYFSALRDENSNTFLLDKPKNPTLCLRFSLRNCGSCTQSALNSLTYIGDNGIDPKYIRAYGTFLSKKNHYLFNVKQKITKIPILNVDDIYFHLALEKEAELPFFFVLFPDGTARHVFIPMKEDVERTRRYLEIIRQKYFSEDQKKI
jgi:hypothetical protein